MFKHLKQHKPQELNLYNKILLLSRNKLLYTKINLNDTFQNRINLIFIHISFLFIKIKQKNITLSYKKFSQKFFDLMFNIIELNLREIGYGDTKINKDMKFFVRTFYNILLECENYKKKSSNMKNIFFNKYLEFYDKKKCTNNLHLVSYFDKYQSFCLDLTEDNVLKGDINFIYK